MAFHVAFHVAGAVALGGVVKDRQPLAHLDHRRQTDALLCPGAVLAIEHHGFVFGIPLVEVLAPINPDGVGVFTLIDPDMIGEEKPAPVAFLVIECRVFDLFFKRDNGIGINRPRAVQVFV